MLNQPAPDFTVVTLGAEGPETFTLSKHIGEKNIVLLFVPMAFTSVCTEQMCSTGEDMSSFSDLDADVYCISGDGPFAQQAWAEKEGISVKMLSDYEHSVAKDYGVAYDQFLPEANLIMGGVAKRSAFVIDKQGFVRHVDIKDHPKDVPCADEIKKALAAL